MTSRMDPQHRPVDLMNKNVLIGYRLLNEHRLIGSADLQVNRVSSDQLPSRW